ncbi:MAG: Type 1 glutamine amidotransferase-like domain-containing protein [Clostridia bacterium]|nr:Type 1 glutamine amidotransferase-like domain-containing protein [Clostridia bacterium]
MGIIAALGGGSFDNGEMIPVAEHIISLSKKSNPSVVFLPTAGFDDINGDEPIRDAFLSLGCSFDILFLTDKSLSYDDIEKKILGCDIIYAGGGNLQFLMDTLKATGADKALRKAYDNGVVMSGLSSGAMCWFTEGYDDCGENASFVFVDCLGFLPHCYCPHFISEHWQSFSNAIKSRPHSGIGVEDGAALVHDGEKYYVISGNEDGDAFFFDKNDGYKKINITNNADIL